MPVAAPLQIQLVGPRPLYFRKIGTWFCGRTPHVTGSVPAAGSAGSMARKLKTFTTSAGFFDLAVAAPSMKAALEAWGSRSNLFQHGFAKISDDPKIVAATMARPGVVLRRPVGSNGAFSQHAKLPTDLPVGDTKRASAKHSAKKREPATEAVDDKTARAAARAFEKEQTRRDSERRKEEAKRRQEHA